MKKGYRTLQDIAPMLEKEYGPEKAGTVLQAARCELDGLCAEHAEDSKAVKAHTEVEIFPCISLYRALEQDGTPKPEAAAFLDRSWSLRAEPNAQAIRTMMKIPGLYKLMPRIFRFVAKSQFGEAAGFRATFYPTEKTRVKFDMTRCLYCDVCRSCGCPELTPCFCHTDDVTDGNMHPKLCWNRTKIMGDGADVCDFDLFVTQEPVQH